MFSFLKKLRKPQQASQESSHQDRIRKKYEYFHDLLTANNSALELMADIEEKASGDFLFDMNYITVTTSKLKDKVSSIVSNLDSLSGGKYRELHNSFKAAVRNIDASLSTAVEIPDAPDTISLKDIHSGHVLIAGGKMAHLGEMVSRLNLPVPGGYVITTAAFRRFFNYQGLHDRLSSLLGSLDLRDSVSLESASRTFQEAVSSAKLPPELAASIATACDSLWRENGSQCMVSVRSSAISEDGEFSFAGQYATFLQVRPEEVAQRYKDVVASLFTPRALVYASSKGLTGADMAMAVGVMCMVPSRSGGVMYSKDPTGQNQGMIVLNGAWGLAKLVVDGSGKIDRFLVSRETGEVAERLVAEKTELIVHEDTGGIRRTAVPESERQSPCLSDEQIRELAKYAMALERHFGRPQDIEWAVDTSGAVRLLQARQLLVHEGEQRKPIPRRLEGHVLLIGKGIIASRGVGCGPVQLVRDERDLADFPDGGVLVARTTSTRFVTVMDRASAIVTDVGGATGHMASLAREYRVPAILDTDVATSVLRQGQVVTVDAFNCNVYEGRADELITYAADRKETLKETSLLRTLSRVMRFIVPLNLTNPEHASFLPESCVTLHDITRFAHEKAMAEMFGMSDTDTMEKEETITLMAGIPIGAHMIDVGGGVREGVRQAEQGDILSVPYAAFLRGLMSMKWPEPRAADVKGFLGMMAHAATIPEEQFLQTAIRSFAVVSGQYMNFSIRLGYHFSMVEAFAGENLNDNYIKFFFKGGGAAHDRRLRRVRLISEILREMDFRVKVVEDVIDAVILKFRMEAVVRRLEILGRMTVYTKQLDMAMYNDDITDWYRDEFIRDHLQGGRRGIDGLGT